MTHPVWEDHLLERKTDRQSKDIRRTAVAFANSVRPGHTAVILIGEENGGKVSGVSNPDEFQMKVRKELDGIYPPIVWRPSLYEKEGEVCIRIEIEHSGDTPHFGDAAWIRQGSESVAATSEQLGILVSLRSGKVRALSEWQGKQISLSIHATGGITPNWTLYEAVLETVTQHYCTFKFGPNGQLRSEPVEWLTISWDHNKNRLRVFVDYKYSNL
jgi:Putative DNA-binding domain